MSSDWYGASYAQFAIVVNTAVPSFNAKTISQSLKSDWQSISGDNNIYELIAAFKRINMILDNLSKALNQQISAQEFKVSATEAASNAAEKVKDVADDAVDAAKQAAGAATDAINQSVADWKSFFI